MADEYIEFKCVRDDVEVLVRTTNVDVTFDELVELFRDFAAGMSYHPNTIEKYFT